MDPLGTERLKTKVRLDYLRILRQVSKSYFLMTPSDQAHLRILKILAEKPEISQRELAGRLGISLGKTNYLIKSLLEKGYVKLQSFQNASNKLKYIYLLTPEGILTKIQLTRCYLVRKEQEYEALRSELEAIRLELAGEEGPQESELTPDFDPDFVTPDFVDEHD
jgi:EPS-associated MarR family transcriptional regulator